MPPFGDLESRERFPVSVEMISAGLEGLLAQVIFDSKGSGLLGSDNTLIVGRDEHYSDPLDLLLELATDYGFTPHYDRPHFVPPD